MLPWAAALIAVVALLIAAYIGFVTTVTGQTLDERALVAGRELLRNNLTQSSALGFLQYLPEISAGVALLSLIAASIVRRSFTAPVIAGVGALGAVLTTQILKAVLPRPDLNISEASMNSFPSGHITVATAAMIAVVLVSSPRWRPVTATLGGVFAATAASATYILSWHRPADAMGAVLVAAAWGLVAGFLILDREPHWNQWERGDERSPSGVWLSLPWVPALVGILGGTGIWYFLLRTSEAPFSDLYGWYVLAGLGAIVGGTMAIFGAAAGLLTAQTRADR